MNEAIQKQLADKGVEIVAQIQTSIAKTTDFAVEQLPDIAHQYIMYSLVSTTVYLVLWLVICLGFGWLLRAGIKNTLKLSDGCSGDMHGARIVMIFAGCAGLLWSIWALFKVIDTLLRIILAPKVYLITALSHLF